MTHRKTLFSSAAVVAAAALLAGAPALRAETTLAGYIEKEARAIEADSATLNRYIRMKNWAQAEQSLAELRGRIEAMSSRLAAIDASSLSAAERERLALLAEKTRLMSHFVERKSNLLEDDPQAHWRMVRAKATNLGHRARLLAKAARGATIPLPATETVSLS